MQMCRHLQNLSYIKNEHMKLPFKIIVDCPFKEICILEDADHIDKEMVLSIINDFEDGRWRQDQFERFILDNLKETALSKKEIETLGGQEFSILSQAVKNLRITENDDTGGEIAEILLYGILRHHYNALPVVPKIFYKQNVNDFAKGADSVHVVIEPEGDFSLWLGEAKFYSDIKDARLGQIISSVSDTLRTDKIRKENSIITNLRQIEDLGLEKEIVDKIYESLDEKLSIDFIKPRLHIPILLLHQCDITKENSKLTEEYIESIKKYHIDRANAFIHKKIESDIIDINLYDEITFHLILFPVPDKKSIVESFIKRCHAIGR